MRYLQRIFSYSRKASETVVSLAFVYMGLNLVFRVCVWDKIYRDVFLKNCIKKDL